MSNVITIGTKAVYPIIFEVDYGQMKSINCYLYQQGESLTLIDAGIDLPAFREFFEQKLKEYGFTIDDIDQILLTHHHGDHIGLVNHIVKQKQVPLYAHHVAIERLQLTEAYQLRKRQFFHQLYEEYASLELAGPRLKKMEQTYQNTEALKINAPIIAFSDGDTVCGLQVMEVPGHSPDSVLFYDSETKWLFVGDLVLYTGTTNALIDHDEQLNLLPTVMQYRQSLEKCLQLDTSVIYAGHQQSFSNLSEIVEKNLQRIDFKLARIVRKVAEGHKTALDLAKAIYGDRMKREFPLIMSEIIGYVTYAEMQGMVEKKNNDGQWEFFVQS
ncbi:MBL fold metallo-hydrolase [Lysinibacillus sp. KU-BSD001]|uniref:MBL fold metallo-hydrolase n=1 Tax=Lysinibacillus sp. KU-BSD001 TaxID=3141328 RepID=UPI0036E4329F